MDFGAHGCHLACLVPPLYRPGGPWDDPGTSGDTRKDTVRSRLGFYRFSVDLGDPFGRLFLYLWSNKIIFISISRLLFLMFFGSESGCLGLENQVFGQGGIAKLNFRRNWIVMIPGSIFHDFGWPWDQFS